MSKDFSDFAESFFASYFNKGYKGINSEDSTGLYALNNDDYTEHTHAVAEWIIEKVINRSVPFISREEFINFEHIAMSCVDNKNYRFVSYMLYKGTRFFNSSEKVTLLSNKTHCYRIKSHKVFKKDKYSVVQCTTIWGHKISFFADKEFNEDIDYLTCRVVQNGYYYNAKDWEVS
jgi:hypothetical protein